MGRIKDSIVFKSILGIVLILAIFTFIVGIIGYQGFTEALLDRYADDAFRTADIAALSVYHGYGTVKGFDRTDQRDPLRSAADGNYGFCTECVYMEDPPCHGLFSSDRGDRREHLPVSDVSFADQEDHR